MDLIHDDTHHLCSHFSINGIKANIHWYFRGKQTIKFAISRNRLQLCLFSRNETTIDSVMQNVRFEFRQN